MSKRLQLILGILFFGLLFVYAGAMTYRLLATPAHTSEKGWSPTLRNGHIIITQVDPKGPAAVLENGDEIIEMDGQPITPGALALEAIRKLESVDPYTITIRRGTQEYRYTLRAASVPLSLVTMLAVTIPAIFLITGFAVFLLKPFDKQALLLAFMFATFIFVPPATVPSFAGVSPWLVPIMLAIHLIALFFYPVFFHFFLIFPEPSSLVRKFPKIEFYLYLPHLVTVFPYLAVLNVLAAVAPERAAHLRDGFPWVNGLLTVLGIAYFAGGLMSLLINYREAGRASRRKMRVVVAGCIAGFLPMSLFVGLAFLFNLPNENPSLSRWLSVIAFFAFPLFPLSFAYAIVRHQVIPIRIILRRGVRYLLVSRGFIIIQALVVFTLLSFLLTGSRMAAIDQLGNRADIIVTMGATAIAILLLTFVNQRVMPIIDRRFFREAYDAHQVLSDLGQAMRTVTTVKQLLELTVARIQIALHIENVTIFLHGEESDNYTCAISSQLTDHGESTADIDRSLFLPREGIIVARLMQTQMPITMDQEGPVVWPRPRAPHNAAATEARKQERKALTRVRSALLLPVAMKDQLLAIVSLGPRLGDLPFSREDRNLLMAVAWQMAFAIQNSQLVREIAEEERLRHELDIATAVQRRLFPDRPPQVERLDLSGICHPARGVGGDYYDFILLDQDRVGIAVADVAGKGISAALLMSTVQASLRSQAPSVNGKLVELVSSMNRLLHVSTDSNSYATFFYAQFEQETGVLTYVNAGHNPPMLVRAETAIKAQGAGQKMAASTDAGTSMAMAKADRDSREVSLLTTGGPVIGAFYSCNYEQEAIQMSSGDLLVAYTDGVTEALNSEGEEFGEARLQTMISTDGQLSAAEMTDRIVASVRDWVGDRPQHDDLTLVVMRVK